MKIVVAGYYGCGNLGDDALLLGLVNALGSRHEITALSGNPEATKGAFDTDAVARKDINAATGAIKASDALVFGGGGLLQDTTSLLSLKYYTHLINTAARAGKRIALLGQGIGPIRSLLGKRAAARAFGQCDLITTRDEGSMRVVDTLAPSTKARRAVTDDLAWLSTNNAVIEPAGKRLAISARPWKEHTPRIVASFREFCARAQSDGWEIAPVSFDRHMDDAVLDQIAPGGKYVDSPQELLHLLSQASGTVAMRLHAGIFSVALGIAPTMVSYDAKVTAFADSVGSEALPLERLDADSLWDEFQRAQSDPGLAERLSRRREIGVRRAAINITMLEEALRPVNTG